jgi:hypothetical protein
VFKQFVYSSGFISYIGEDGPFLFIWFILLSVSSIRCFMVGVENVGVVFIINKNIFDCLKFFFLVLE